MKLLFLILSFYSFSALANNNIDCSGATCVPNFMSQTIEKPQYSAITVNENTDHINVSVSSGNDPRSIRLYVKNNNFPGKNLNVNLSSSRSASNAGNSIIIGDSFANLTMLLNGFSGSKGRDVSELCAEKMKTGAYGPDAQTFFINRRQSQAGLNPNRCDMTDLNFIQSFGFTCDDSSYQILANGLNPTVSAKRLKTKARCSGILVRDMCLKRKVIATCTYRAYWVSCGKKGGCDSGYSGDAYTYSRKYAEEEFKYKKSIMPGEQFCRNEMPPMPGLQALLAQGSYLTTPGVNPATTIPLAGSDWELQYTQAYGSCLTFWTTIRTVYSAVNVYTSNGTSCNPYTDPAVGIPEDPNKLIPWSYNGMTQESNFEPEIVDCSPGECPVQSTLSDLERFVDRLVPESGTSGTQQGAGSIFVYDAQNLSFQSNLGQAGAAGQIDLNSPESTKYCAKVRDYDSDGATSDFAKVPNVSFRRYRWRAIKTESGGNNGNAPIQTGKSINIYKKVDEFQRHLLSKLLL